MLSFFAVTMTSVYHVYETDKAIPIVEKISIRDGMKSVVPANSRLRSGEAILLSNMGIFVCISMRVSTQEKLYAIDNTTPIVGLFLEKEDANTCANSKSKKSMDPTWIESTLKVIQAIGVNHPWCKIDDVKTFINPELFPESRVPQN